MERPYWREDLLPRASQLHIDVHLVPPHAASDFASRLNLFAQRFFFADGRQPVSKEVLSKVTQCDKGNGKKAEGNTEKLQQGQKKGLKKVKR